MFTGIIEEVGRVRGRARQGDGVRLSIASDHVREGLRLGDSVALDGVCQTVIALDDDGFEVDAIGPTLARTTLGGLDVDGRVNLERALAFGGRIGGHLVQGHVDDVGRVARIEPTGEHVLLDVALTGEVADVTVPRGSIAINGVSLTVNARPEPEVARVALIPYTWRHTNLSDLRVGDPVNLEGDMIGRFVVAYLERRQAPESDATASASHGDRRTDVV